MNLKKNTYVAFFFLISMILSSMISLNFINVAADEGGGPPYMDWDVKPDPPNDKCYWDFNNGTLVGWHISGDIGNRDFIYNITSMRYLKNILPEGHAYGVLLQEVYYDMVNREIKAYPESSDHPIVNASLTNFTLGRIYPCDPYVPSYNLANYFIPKNDTTGNPLTIAWSANALSHYYGWMLSNYTSDICDVIYYGNTIELYNSTEGTYVNLTYDSHGILIDGKLKVYFGGPNDRAAPKIVNYSRVYNFQKDWDLTLGDKVGWHLSGDFGPGVESDLIYNITKIDYFFNATGHDIYGKEPYHYGVSLTPMIWNVSLNTLQIANLSINPILNVSLVNVTYSLLEPFSRDVGSGLGLLCNPFIHKNSSGILDIDWCAEAMRQFYSQFLMGGAQKYANMQVSGNSILYTNDTAEAYCSLTYDNNGILTYGELHTDFQGQGIHTVTYTRIYDFNPLNNIDWTDEFDQVGESMIYYMNETKLKFDFIKTNNTMEYDLEFEDGEWRENVRYYQQVWANFSTDDGSGWNYEGIIAIGQANEYLPIILGGGDGDGGPLPIYLVPSGTNGEDLAKVWKPLVDFGQLPFDGLLNGSNWIEFIDSSLGDYTVFKYFADGMLQYIYSTNGSKSFISPYGGPTFIYPENYVANLTDLIKDTALDFSFQPSGMASFNVSIHINMTEDTKLVFTGFSKQPIQTSLSNALFYFDIWFNRTNVDSLLSEPINISVIYKGSTKYSNIKIYFYNETSKAWELVSFSLINNVFEISLTHASLFAFTGVTPSTFPTGGGGGGGDNNKEKEAAIPFGNYYLIFLALAVIGLVIYKKRKL
ncbi:MAG: hypothetical protein ACFFHV_14675 [Promethearchaeota archaeon]